MKVKLLRDTQPFGRTGDIVEVSPSAREWLLSLGMAVPAKEIGEQIETPEKAPAAETAVKIPAKTASKPAAKAPAKKPAAKKEKGK